MTKKDYTHISLVVDRSGSMAGLASDVDGSILTLLKEQSEVPGDLSVDIVTFDTEITTPYTMVDPLDVKPPICVPRGGTALNDAIGMTIVRLGETLAKMDEDSRPDKVIFVIATDGHENSSKEYTLEQVKAMVEKQTSEFQWEFIYLAANVDAFATGGNYGFRGGQTMNVAATAAGFGGGYMAASATITRSRSGLSTDFTEEERSAAQQ